MAADYKGYLAANVFNDGRVVSLLIRTSEDEPLLAADF